MLLDGTKLGKLREAIAYLGKIIAKAEHDMPEVQTAADLLTKAADHDGPVEFARIGTLRAINRHVERVFDPARKGSGMAPWKTSMTDDPGPFTI